MTIELSEYWTRLVRSGLSDTEGCRELASTFAKANSGTPPSDARALARFMVKRGDLTKYQARCLLASPLRELRVGGFVIRNDQADMPFSRWLEVKRLQDGAPGLLLQIEGATEDPELIAVLKKHQSVSARSLQSLELDLHADSAMLFSRLPSGACLLHSISEGPSLPAKEVCRIGIEIADGLEALHRHSLAHGQVSCDRVWMGDDGEVLLLRDPSSVFSSAAAATAWLDHLESISLYAAPELSGSGQAACVATDIYSLGCLLFRLVTGRLPFSGEDDQATEAAHRSETPAEISEAVGMGEKGDPLFRVLAFALAKNPNARFGSAAQFSKALQAVSKSLDAKPGDDSGGQTTTASGRHRATSAEKEPVAKSNSRSTKKKQRPQPIESSKPKSVKETPRNQADSSTSKEAKRKTKRKAKTTDPSPDVANRQPESKPPVTIQKSSDLVKSPPALPPSESHAAQALVQAPPPPSDVPPIESTPTDSDSSTQRDRPVRRRRKKKKSKAPLVLGSMCVAVLVLIIGLIAGGPGESESEARTRPKPTDVIPRVKNLSKSQTQDDVKDSDQIETLGYELVADESLLFAPPHPADSASPPLDLLPPGPSMIITARISKATQDPTGALLTREISPEFNALLESAVKRANTSLESIRRLTVALYPGSEGWPETSLMVELEETITEDELIARFDVEPARTPDGATVYAGDDQDSDAIYWKATEDKKISQFAIGSVPQISEVAAVEGSSIPLPRASQALWNAASGQSDLVILITPNFLFADGRQLLAAAAPELSNPLRRFMQPDVAAAVLSVSFAGSERVFVEAMFAPSGQISEAALMKKLDETINAWPRWADDFILNTVTDPSWRLLASRLPSMVQFVVGQTRFGISDGIVVTNAYLPSNAFPQITLATLLAMNTPKNATQAVVGAAMQDSLSVPEMLDREMTVSFDQESLEFALEAIVNAFSSSLPAGSTMPPARIIGGDLQMMGITQNQQVRDFALTDEPLRRVLTELVLRANPDKSAEGPSDPKQALIWVVLNDPAKPGQSEILITTRLAAQSKNYEVPREFTTQPASDQ